MPLHQELTHHTTHLSPSFLLPRPPPSALRPPPSALRPPPSTLPPARCQPPLPPRQALLGSGSRSADKVPPPLWRRLSSAVLAVLGAPEATADLSFEESTAALQLLARLARLHPLAASALLDSGVMEVGHRPAQARRAAPCRTAPRRTAPRRTARCRCCSSGWRTAPRVLSIGPPR